MRVCHEDNCRTPLAVCALLGIGCSPIFPVQLVVQSFGRNRIHPCALVSDQSLRGPLAFDHADLFIDRTYHSQWPVLNKRVAYFGQYPRFP